METGFNKKEWFVFTIKGIKFGIETNRIAKMIPLKEAKQEDMQIWWFHEKISFSGQPILYQAPMVLLIKNAQEKMGIVIDQPEMILSFTGDEIHSLPAVIRQFAGTISILWVALKDNAIILLIDFDRLLES